MAERPIAIPWEGIRERRPLPWFLEIWPRLFREKPLGAAGAVIVAAVIILAIFAPLIAPHGYNEMFFPDRLKPPSAQYWFGTDNFARDILSRVIYGARVSVVVGFSAVFLTEALALFLGALGGYYMGWFDHLSQRVVEAVMAVPGIVFLILVLSLTGPGLFQVVFAIGIGHGIRHSRIYRGTVIGIKENMYMEGARAIGCSQVRILLRYILPNIMAPLIIDATILLGTVILLEASLSFLGYGIPPPTPSWGEMLSRRARHFMLEAPWMALWPGVFLSLTIYGWSLFGDALRDLLDPRLRGGGGRLGRR